MYLNEIEYRFDHRKENLFKRLHKVMERIGDAMNQAANNTDEKVVADFGSEWSRFGQSELSSEEREVMFDDYFRIFPWDQLPASASGADIGCGSGRWAVLVAPQVAHLHCVDASAVALDVARRNLHKQLNVEFHLASVEDLPFPDSALDFAYSLGVLHHVPDTAAAVKSVARVLKPGAPLLLYLYYAFDTRPFWFKLLWRVSDIARRVISCLPSKLKNLVCDVIAALVYWPLARLGLLLERLRLMPASWPLSSYRDKSFYTLRTDALDRFGTRLEQRYTQAQIRSFMSEAGLIDLHFSDHPPYWCVVGYKK